MGIRDWGVGIREWGLGSGASRGSGTNNTVVAILASALARFGTNLAPWVALRYDILQNVVNRRTANAGWNRYFQSGEFVASDGRPISTARSKHGGFGALANLSQTRPFQSTRSKQTSGIPFNIR